MTKCFLTFLRYHRSRYRMIESHRRHPQIPKAQRVAQIAQAHNSGLRWPDRPPPIPSGGKFDILKVRYWWRCRHRHRHAQLTETHRLARRPTQKPSPGPKGQIGRPAKGKHEIGFRTGSIIRQRIRQLEWDRPRFRCRCYSTAVAEYGDAIRFLSVQRLLSVCASACSRLNWRGLGAQS